MRHAETLPAWVARQRSRRLVRHADEKVVRWIGRNQPVKGEPAEAADTSSNDNLVGFQPERSIKVS